MLTQNGLSQEEIWDDSALLQSWGDALEEYKRYHSILARGEKVEHVLNALETQNASPDANGGSERGSPLDDAEGADRDAGECSPGSDRNTNPNHKIPKTSDSKPELRENVERKPGEDILPSQKPIGEMQGDESIRNIMMSWYWAGYYTGLNEGRAEAKLKFSRD